MPPETDIRLQLMDQQLSEMKVLNYELKSMLSQALFRIERIERAVPVKAGYSLREAAARLGVAPRTAREVCKHVTRFRDKPIIYDPAEIEKLATSPL